MCLNTSGTYRFMCVFWNFSHLQKYLLGIVDFHDHVFMFIHVCLLSSIYSMIYVASKFYMVTSVAFWRKCLFDPTSSIENPLGLMRENSETSSRETHPHGKKKNEYDPFWAQAFAWPVSGTKVVKLSSEYYTSLKSNVIYAQNDAIFEAGDTFSKPSFWSLHTSISRV